MTISKMNKLEIETDPYTVSAQNRSIRYAMITKF